MCILTISIQYYTEGSRQWNSGKEKRRKERKEEREKGKEKWRERRREGKERN